MHFEEVAVFTGDDWTGSKQLAQDESGRRREWQHVLSDPCKACWEYRSQRSCLPISQSALLYSNADGSGRGGSGRITPHPHPSPERAPVDLCYCSLCGCNTHPCRLILQNVSLCFSCCLAVPPPPSLSCFPPFTEMCVYIYICPCTVISLVALVKRGRLTVSGARNRNRQKRNRT